MRRQALCLLEQVASEMEVCYEDRSETWQDSERGEAFSEVMELVTEIADELKEIPSLQVTRRSPLHVKRNVTLGNNCCEPASADNGRAGRQTNRAAGCLVEGSAERIIVADGNNS